MLGWDQLNEIWSWLLTRRRNKLWTVEDDEFSAVAVLNLGSRANGERMNWSDSCHEEIPKSSNLICGIIYRPERDQELKLNYKNDYCHVMIDFIDWGSEGGIELLKCLEISQIPIWFVTIKTRIIKAIFCHILYGRRGREGDDGETLWIWWSWRHHIDKE